MSQAPWHLCLFAALVLAGCEAAPEPETLARWPGRPAPSEPLQVESNLPAPFHYMGFTLSPLARYTVTAVVLCRKRYYADFGSIVSPVDLGLGWGALSEAPVINSLQFSQAGRFLMCSGPLTDEEMITQSANTHCLATGKVRAAVLAVRRHELVTLDGYLVSVSAPVGDFTWVSSLTRDDTGPGACEVLWVNRVKRQNPAGALSP
jgi:hypothetical protein